MTCIECGGQMKSGPVELSGRYRGTELRVEMPRGFACGKCEYKTIHGRDMGEFRARLKDAYRQKSQRLTPKQVKQTRISLGASQQLFADFLDVGMASVKRWESGGLQDAAMDEKIRLRSNPHLAEIAVQDMYFAVYRLQGALRELPGVGNQFGQT